ncbi:glutathione S-transferase family protein [Pseudoteredinibacter isoporae]|uniref:Glutathione S-transferase n=1 Tax=Pseudoteredinibacter isoporae TaxID=570281 RepID=A0A7X0MVX4_9GAMM|nr:glutathione S-transferase family protein [Pseudoteredinibacter isoporae]MBB6522181.1 glutathione S-transferase [Pseudoteredinibacter isoporae]NHO87715.1 glutathione S-transferase family protein [Pseudoteredinibacter isoporae]NIB23954.1 glutathione S-transferase family protein [Pseudoteredinibacter isoporae]
MAKIFPNPTELEGIHLFFHPVSNCATRVYLALAEKALPFEGHVVNLLKSEQLNKSFLLLNPKAEVPALVHDGKAYSESIDVLYYLEEQFPEISLSPENPADKSLMDQWLEKARNSHEQAVVNYVYSHGIGRLPTPRDNRFYEEYIPHRADFHRQRRAGVKANNAKSARALVDQQCREIDQQLETQNWLAGGQFTLADIAWFANVHTLQLLGYRPPKLPHLQDWQQRISERPAYRQYRRELPALPLCLFPTIAKLVSRIVRRQGHRF